MADAISVQIADAIATAIDAHVFTVAFTPTRTWIPNRDLVDAGTIAVTVLPRGETQELQSRGKRLHTYEILIDVRQRVDPADVDDVDALVALVEEIGDYLCNRTMASANWTKTEQEVLYGAQELYTMHEFVSQLTVSYVLQRTA